jgi:phage portal protein BeeE
MATGYIQNHGADIPEAAVDSLLARWRAKRKANSTAYLTSTLEYKTIGYSPKDMMYNEAIQFFATQIARACNLSAYWLDADVTTSNTYQNRIDVRKDLVDLTLRSFISSVEDRLSMDDICPRGQMVRFAVDETFLRNDPITRLTVIEKMLQLQLIDLGEAKEMEGLADEGNDSLSLVEDATVLELPNAMGEM